MRFYKKLVYSITFALIIFFISLFFHIVPCQKAPDVPNPEYKWSLCTLNPDINIQSETIKIYFGLTQTFIGSYIFIIAISFIIAFIVLSTVLKSKE